MCASLELYAQLQLFGQIQHFGPLFVKEGAVVGIMRLVMRWKGKVLAHLLRGITVHIHRSLRHCSK